MLPQAGLLFDEASVDLEWGFSQATFEDSSGREFVFNKGISFAVFDNIVWTTTGGQDSCYIEASVIDTNNITRGHWLVFDNTNGNVTIDDRLLMIDSIAETVTDISGTDYYLVTVRFDGAVGEYAFDLTTTSTSGLEFYLIAGIHADDFVEGDNGYFYFDLEAMSIANGSEYNIEKEELLSVNNPYVEGVSIVPTTSATSFSTRERPVLKVTKYIQDKNLKIDSTALNIAVSYEIGYDLSQMQTTVENEEYRVVGEDILIKHFYPAFVVLNISGTGLSQTDGVAYLKEFVDSLDKSLEISDLISFLYSKGATKITLPIEVTVERTDTHRTTYTSHVSDSLEISQSERFYFSTKSTYTVV